MLLIEFLPMSAHAQEECPDLIEQAEMIAAQRDVDAALGQAMGLEALQRLMHDDRHCPVAEALLLRAVAANEHILGDYPQALERIDAALELIDDVHDPAVDAQVHLNAGVVNWAMERHDAAIAHYLASLESSRQAGDQVGVGRAAGNIGNLYSSLGRLEQAREYHQKALVEFEAADWKAGLAGTHVNLSALAGRLARRAEQDDDTAAARSEYSTMLDHARRALAYFESLDNPRGIAYGLTNVATALDGLGRPEDALEYHERAVSIQREIGDEVGQQQTLINMADALQRLGRPDEALELLRQVADRLPEDSVGLALDVVSRKVVLAEELSAYRQALAYQRELTDLRQRSIENRMAARVDEVSGEMEAMQRQQELERLRTESEIADLKLRRQQAVTALAVVVAVLLLGLLGAVYARYRLGLRVTRRLHVAASTDPLTGLPNRREMLDRLHEAEKDCISNGTHHALILADIDDFKQINDQLGHSAGDRVMERLAEVFSQAVKGRDLVARWGGEEFLFLLPETGLKGARSVAENLRRAVVESPMRHNGEEINLTLTAGVSVLQSGISVEEAIRRADDAMYQGKANGKNRVEVDRSAQSDSEAP